nr:hypothetical protein [Deltaproteobacteria bacterium]
MIGVKVNICTDLSAGVLMHNVLLPPPIPVPVPSISIEMAVNQDWPPGEFANTHKRAATVQHKGRRIVLEGHDCGPMIPDVTPLFPLNYFYLIMWPFSSRKFTFSASTVQADGAPIGCAAPYLPMMSCGDPISAPTGIALTSMNNTGEVGMTGTDLAIGLATAAVSGRDRLALSTSWAAPCGSCSRRDPGRAGPNREQGSEGGGAGGDDSRRGAGPAQDDRARVHRKGLRLQRRSQRR